MESGAWTVPNLYSPESRVERKMRTGSFFTAESHPETVVGIPPLATSA